MLKLVTRFDGHVVQVKKVMLNISQGHNEVGFFFWYKFVKHVLYFVESAAALNEVRYF